MNKTIKKICSVAVAAGLLTAMGMCGGVSAAAAGKFTMPCFLSTAPFFSKQAHSPLGNRYFGFGHNRRAPQKFQPCGA